MAHTSIERAALLALSATLPSVLEAQSTVRAEPPFVVTGTSVRQGRFEAVALSRDTIVSSYPRAAREVRFRFSINGAENEFPSGTEHTIYLRPRGGRMVTALYRFGDEREPGVGPESVRTRPGVTSPPARRASPASPSASTSATSTPPSASAASTSRPSARASAAAS